MHNDLITLDAYSESSFWKKAGGFAKQGGYAVTEKALWLYYAAQKPSVPAKAKTVIWGALGYFILPLDAVVDALPVVGFGDDLVVLTTALAVVAMHIDGEVKQRANAKLQEWFG